MATKKGFHLLIERAARALRAAVPGAHVVLAGGGDRLEEFRARAAPLAGRVHFPGPVLHDTLPDLYRAADLFVLPAVHDRQGQRRRPPQRHPGGDGERAAGGGAAVSGIPLAVRDGEEGVLVPEGDGRALREALAALLGDPERGRRMGEAGRRRAVAELGWDAVAARYRAAYAEGAARRRAGTKPALAGQSEGGP